MLAERYTDDRERGNAMAIALGGLALGVLGQYVLQWYLTVKQTMLLSTHTCTMPWQPY